jgi:mono/diheme cytochrome c family protein
VPAASSSPKRDRALLGAGRKIYENRCASCHGNQGEGVPGAYPALADNRTVTSASPVNVVRAIVLGGMAPTTAGNPRPYGMPPFGAELNDAEIAAVSTFVRSAWGNDAPTVSAVEVLRAR